MTPKNKKVKTHFLSAGFELTAASGADTLSHDLWIPQDDITIIGINARIAILEDGLGWDEGRLTVLVDFSRIGKLQQPGTILSFCHSQVGQQMVIGVDSAPTLKGPPNRGMLFFFPEGYGIDMDEQEPVYMHTSWANSMTNKFYASVGGAIYFVER